ncbi:MULTISPECIES: hypothetical protein [unclassified Sphingomonas]|uniref:hypothetical protein n=1 Tax=unclassified Sphingomonas TaxID=196159 RepID=UPI0006F97F9D|nr:MULTISPECIES: hypothetical protein [unclassified Sphingomonas]KQX18379.1 hypothetical protein ASD17_14555 [Sphingomonas sp. Root1294]KQY72296.1 hypothetical protein ASD39_20420 [Sphingomonas sp. Root50]KRB94433.1 hypothetical protein ASE22_00330 [Sphingomonas sp. Root720]
MVNFSLTPVAANHKVRIGCSDHDLLGDIPAWLSEHSPLGAAAQIDRWYQHGGGWREFKGFAVDLDKMTITYPGDPAIPAIAEASLREERIIIFNGAWVAVIQPDGSHSIARID